MDNDRILWASPKKRVQKLSSSSTGQSTTTSDRKSKIQSESILDDTNYDLVAQLEFSPEVAAIMSTYEAAGLALGSDPAEKHGKLLRSTVQSAPDSSSTSKPSSHQATSTTISSIEAPHSLPLSTVALKDRPQFEAKKAEPVSLSSSVAMGSSPSGPTSLSLSAGVKDISPAHWSYNGVSFLPACYSSHHPSSSSSSISFSSFTPTVRPIPCTPLNPWYLSNGIPNFSKQVTSASHGMGDDAHRLGALARSPETVISSASSSAFVAIQESTSASVSSSVSASAAVSVSDSTVQKLVIDPISAQQPQSRPRKTKAREEILRGDEVETDTGHEQPRTRSLKRAKSGEEEASESSPTVSVAKRKRSRLSDAVSLESERNKTLEASLLAALLPQTRISSRDRK